MIGVPSRTGTSDRPVSRRYIGYAARRSNLDVKERREKGRFFFAASVIIFLAAATRRKERATTAFGDLGSRALSSYDPAA